MPRKQTTVAGKPASKTGPSKSASTAKRAPTASTSSPRGITNTGSKRKLEDSDAVKVSSTGTKKHKASKSNDKQAQSRREHASRPKQAVPGSKGRPRAQPVTSLNRAPTRCLNIYVFGGNSGGELGLGVTRSADNVARPRLNPNLASDTVGVVQLATGGMHCAALTRNNKLLTWGVNDHGALGRDTTWDGGLVDLKDGDESDSGSESGLNPRESTPTEVDMSEVPQGTVFTQLAASDNATFALTDQGLVYGWGTIRGNDGVLGFSSTQKIQPRPALLPSLKMVTKIVTGTNHALALTSKGSVYVWGSGEQNQLGRRLSERRKTDGLQPRAIGHLKDLVDIGAGSDHSFAINRNNDVYAWGLNSFGQTGIADNAGESEAVTAAPALIKSLTGHGKVIQITGGNHHSLAVTDNGDCLVWGRVDCYATGLKLDNLHPNHIIRDLNNKPRILTVPTPVPGIGQTAFAAAGSDHTIAISKDFKAFSWGFNVDRQTGQKTDEDIECATLIEHAAVNGQKLVWAGAGGQYSILAGEALVAINSDR